MRISGPKTLTPARRARQDAAPPAAQCLQLLLACVQAGSYRPRGGFTVAFTSANPGEGVSHVIRHFATELATATGKRTVVIDAHRLQRLRVADYVQLPQGCVRTAVPNLWLLPRDEFDDDAGGRGRQVSAWQNDPEFGLDRLAAIGSSFDYTLIDCPSIKTSYEAGMLAPNVDGMVLVVEADRTKRDQIQRARQTIEMADGNLLGLVLNRRRYSVPRWLYRML